MSSRQKSASQASIVYRDIVGRKPTQIARLRGDTERVSLAHSPGVSVPSIIAEDYEL
ncbi:hypothetical protein BAUCODRAFT_331212 [Baudoinia panamericana UAMH 10762]|uniref:Uncharacterized protein n=1 Tax=Baudoinia panamericana (strain UAMH 10762) TaxID=717646 RepID=M2MXD1_BAUPA|nr:uncharacterized protein BAUCODRAFT_331212 [Baudoinia panamericana UAMH 10762]EMC90910.1 hypothetical protein BAUCODRAFT_331212 [Baudoinia panamericana UAMH 10762]